MSANISALFYLITGILFILALRGLSSPETSRQGNYLGIAGMTISIIVTFLSVGSFGPGFIYVLIFSDEMYFKICTYIFVCNWCGNLLIIFFKQKKL